MREAFTSALMAAARDDENILLLTGDHGNALFAEFRQAFPDRFINCGIAEQNMIGVAAGLAKSGFRPIVYALSAFSPMRVIEQIKLDVCCDELPVLIVGDGAGIVYGTLGVTHQTAEDIAIMRALPNMKILSPADGQEMSAAMTLALATPKPVYLRMGKGDLGGIHTASKKIQWGRLISVLSGNGDMAFIATGSMLFPAMKLAAEWPGSTVWSAPSLKPLDVEAVVSACGRHRMVVTLEEHNVIGGLGGAVAEILSQERPMPVCRIGISDRFSEFCGSYPYLMKEHGLSIDAIRVKIQAFRKKLGLG